MLVRYVYVALGRDVVASHQLHAFVADRPRIRPSAIIIVVHHACFILYLSLYWRFKFLLDALEAYAFVAVVWIIAKFYWSWSAPSRVLALAANLATAGWQMAVIGAIVRLVRILQHRALFRNGDFWDHLHVGVIRLDTTGTNIHWVILFVRIWLCWLSGQGRADIRLRLRIHSRIICHHGSQRYLLHSLKLRKRWRRLIELSKLLGSNREVTDRNLLIILLLLLVVLMYSHVCLVCIARIHPIRYMVQHVRYKLIRISLVWLRSRRHRE